MFIDHIAAILILFSIPKVGERVSVKLLFL